MANDDCIFHITVCRPDLYIFFKFTAEDQVIHRDYTIGADEISEEHEKLWVLTFSLDTDSESQHE